MNEETRSERAKLLELCSRPDHNALRVCVALQMPCFAVERHAVVLREVKGRGLRRLHRRRGPKDCEVGQRIRGLTRLLLRQRIDWLPQRREPLRVRKFPLIGTQWRTFWRNPGRIPSSQVLPTETRCDHISEPLFPFRSVLSPFLQPLLRKTKNIIILST